MRTKTVDLSQAVLRLRIDAELRERIVAAASADRSSVSEYVRRALRSQVQGQRVAA
jgi:predicted HicB family RNase H-like nuclease